MRLPHLSAHEYTVPLRPPWQTTESDYSDKQLLLHTFPYKLRSRRLFCFTTQTRLGMSKDLICINTRT